MNQNILEFNLYGDGIHDDTDGIQALLDSGASEVVLTAPKSAYLISKTLKIHAGQTLRMAPTTCIRLADDSNCAMIENDCFSSFSENICIDGGIWDMRNTEQEPNPWHFPGKDGKTSYDRLGLRLDQFGCFTEFPAVYTGFCMRFCRIRNFTLKNVTFRNPVTYGAQFGFVENFTVRDIVFDYNSCNPKFWNMDGIHIEGGCKNGIVTNLKGACHDDLVAITADDSLYGSIENIVVDGIFAEQSHSAVRLLSHGISVKNIQIRNIFGSYYTYCIGITKYHGEPEERGVMHNISIENICAASSKGTKDVVGGQYPFIWVQSGVDIEGLRIENVFREEKTYPTPLFRLDKNASVRNLILRNITQKNLLNSPAAFIELLGDSENPILNECRDI